MSTPAHDETVDEIDRNLLDALCADGRATLAALGAEVGLSPPAVKRRIDRLMDSGVIQGFTAIIDEARVGPPLHAFTELKFAGNTRVAEIARVARGMSEVKYIFTLAGDADALVWLAVQDAAHLTETVDRLRRTGKVVGTKTTIVLAAWSPEGRPNADRATRR